MTAALTPPSDNVVAATCVRPVGESTLVGTPCAATPLTWGNPPPLTASHSAGAEPELDGTAAPSVAGQRRSLHAADCSDRERHRHSAGRVHSARQRHGVAAHAKEAAQHGAKGCLLRDTERRGAHAAAEPRAEGCQALDWCNALDCWCPGCPGAAGATPLSHSRHVSRNGLCAWRPRACVSRAEAHADARRSVRLQRFELRSRERSVAWVCS